MYTTRELVSYLVSYPGPLNLAVLLLFVGSCICSSGGFIGDSCSFVYATIDKSVGDISETLERYLPAGSRRGLGFTSWELENGKCSDVVLRWKFNATNAKLHGSYNDFLGGDWRAPAMFGSVAYVLSLFIWLFSLVLNLIVEDNYNRRFSLRHLRYTVPALCLVILVPFQSATLLVLTSDFCDNADCEMGDGAWISISAVLCFFFSGILFLVMGDPPEIPDFEAYVAAYAATGNGGNEEASLGDTEELTISQSMVQDLNDGLFDAQEIEFSPTRLLAAPVL